MCLPPAAECQDGNEIDWDGCTQGHASELLISPVPGDCHDGGALVAVGSSYRVFWLVRTGGEKEGDRNIESMTLDADGNPTSQKSTIVEAIHEDASGAAPAGLVDATRLDDGHILLAYRGTDDGAKFSSTHLVWFQADGTIPTNEVNVMLIWQEQTEPSVAAVPGGGFGLAWSGNGQTQNSKAGTYYIFFDESSVPMASVALVSYDKFGSTCGPHRPDLAVSPKDGSTLAAWVTPSPPFCPPSVLSGADFPRIESRGIKIGGESTYPPTQINVSGLAPNADVALAPFSDDAFVAVWTSETDSPVNPEWGIAARIVGVDSQPVGDEFQVSSTKDPGLYSRVRASSVTGASWAAAWNFRTWEASPPNDQDDVYVRVSSVAPGPEIAASRANVFVPGPQKIVGLAAGPVSGTYLAAWCSCGNAPNGGCGIFSRRIKGGPL